MECFHLSCGRVAVEAAIVTPHFAHNDAQGGGKPTSLALHLKKNLGLKLANRPFYLLEEYVAFHILIDVAIALSDGCKGFECMISPISLTSFEEGFPANSRQIQRQEGCAIWKKGKGVSDPGRCAFAFFNSLSDRIRGTTALFLQSSRGAHALYVMANEMAPHAFPKTWHIVGHDR
jgi:hypothetical protein